MPKKNKFIFIVAAVLLLQTSINSIAYSQVANSDKKRSTLELMNLLTYNLIKDNPLKKGDYAKGDWNTVKKSKLPKAMNWLYPTGVSLLAMERVFDISHDKKIIEFINNNQRISADQYAYLRWQKDKFGTVFSTEGFFKLWRLDMLDDYGAIAASILETNLRHKIPFTKNVKELIDITGNFIEHIQYRLPDETFWRPNSEDGPTVWADDLFMSLPFLIRLAEYKKDTALLTDAAKQIINYAKLLQDEDGVFFHAYFTDKKEHSCCKWARANGWAAVGIAEVLSVLPKTHAKYKQVFDIYKKQITGLIKYQAADGFWNQIIDHPELSWGTETSSSAQFTYAIARGINKGWLDKSYLHTVEKSLATLCDTSRISTTGVLHKVCASTSIGKDLNYYNTRLSEEGENYTDHHGDGLILLALTEMHILLNKK